MELTEIWNELLRLKGEVKILQKKYEYYTQQFETISRVVSRRGQEKMRL
jgi:archaellum component FlaC